MKAYIGTKFVLGDQMSRGQFEQLYPNVLKGTNLPSEDGYLVQYADGYKSWSPKDVFERCYREITKEEKDTATFMVV